MKLTGVQVANLQVVLQEFETGPDAPELWIEQHTVGPYFDKQTVWVMQKDGHHASIHQDGSVNWLRRRDNLPAKAVQ